MGCVDLASSLARAGFRSELLPFNEGARLAGLVERLHCIRCYVGIETDADQGLKTLQRWAQPRHNWGAMELVERLGLYTRFNVLLFDPDTTLESLEDNLAFMEAHAQHPFNFGRTELYAGTPLLHRMQREGRARGDWLQWDYSRSWPGWCPWDGR